MGLPTRTCIRKNSMVFLRRPSPAKFRYIFGISLILPPAARILWTMCNAVIQCLVCVFFVLPKWAAFARVQCWILMLCYRCWNIDPNFPICILGKGGTDPVGGLRDCDHLRKSVRRSHQGTLDRWGHRRMLRQKKRISAHRLRQIVRALAGRWRLAF